MSAKHTPGPWFISRPHQTLYIESRIAGGMIQEVASIGPNANGWSESEANARRIVACVNACDGIPTEALEKGRMSPDAFEANESRADKAEAHVDELLDALQWLVDLMPDPELDSDPVQREQVIKAKVAIAKATNPD